MNFFKPTFIKKTLSDITPDMLRAVGVSYILLDVDNTLASYISHEPISGAIEWVKNMRNQGFHLMIVSNNYKRRVEPFAQKFGLPYVTFACKPLPFGYLQARKILKAPASSCAIIGDQIFTDVVGANLCGMKSVLLEPVELEHGALFKFRRKQERKLREKYQNGKKGM